MQRNTQRICTLFLVLSLCLAGLLPAATAQAQSSANWQVFYYPNTSWQGNPVYVQNAGTVAFNWGSDTPPGPGMPSQNWTARLVSTVFFNPASSAGSCRPTTTLPCTSTTCSMRTRVAQTSRAKRS